jgi:transcription elongation GreA/GreB family factor
MEILEREIYLLGTINPELKSETIGFGSLVKTDQVMVLVGAAQERMFIDDVPVMGISMAAPLMRAMEGKGEGDEVSLGRIRHKIEAVL